MDNRSEYCPNCGGWLEFDIRNGEFLGCDTCDYFDKDRSDIEYYIKE